MRGHGGGVAAGTTIAASAACSMVVTLSSLVSWLLRVDVVGHRRQWHNTLSEGAAHQGDGTAEGGWGGRPLGFGSSGSEKREPKLLLPC
jgi:hypothetical protein